MTGAWALSHHQETGTSKHYGASVARSRALERWTGEGDVRSGQHVSQLLEIVSENQSICRVFFCLDLLRIDGPATHGFEMRVSLNRNATDLRFSIFEDFRVSAHP